MVSSDIDVAGRRNLLNKLKKKMRQKYNFGF